MKFHDFNFFSLKEFCISIGLLVIQHPLLSVLIIFFGFVVLMWISHILDIAEGDARNWILLFFFLIFLISAIVIFLLALQEGTIAFPNLIGWIID
jgi:hypothetical protein